MHGDDVDDYRNDEHQEERQVQEVPQREQALMNGQARRLADRREMIGHIVLKFTLGLPQAAAGGGLGTIQVRGPRPQFATDDARHLARLPPHQPGVSDGADEAPLGNKRRLRQRRLRM